MQPWKNVLITLLFFILGFAVVKLILCIFSLFKRGSTKQSMRELASIIMDVYFQDGILILTTADIRNDNELENFILETIKNKFNISIHDGKNPYAIIQIPNRILYDGITKSTAQRFKDRYKSFSSTCNGEDFFLYLPNKYINTLN